MSRPLSIPPLMRPILLAACIALSGCAVAQQPDSARTVAAFEVPLPSQVEREKFLSVLRSVAKEHSMHVDSATQEELERHARISPAFKMTMNASVWRGTNDEESIASAMDQPDHLGHVWISFSRGKDPALNGAFREAAMREVVRNWPETLSLPIMPTGAIPLHRDLIRTPQGYVVDPTKAHQYGLQGGIGELQ